ncbi:hypothetical protein BSIN_0122 [Burkholderia singularis]|uniref:Uncharacterized protein n=1 Tax=Burkholderia singularis TaxID=1503053 RepID=A0A238H2E1_9BURK|nr:hypothetical protein BSIN_0122 [Burkholderia singularis]
MAGGLVPTAVRRADAVQSGFLPPLARCAISCGARRPQRSPRAGSSAYDSSPCSVRA